MTDYYCNWCIVAILRFLSQSTSRHVVMSAMIYHQKMAPLFGEALCTYLYYGYHHILCSTLKVCKKKCPISGSDTNLNFLNDIWTNNECRFAMKRKKIILEKKPKLLTISIILFISCIITTFKHNFIALFFPTFSSSKYFNICVCCNVRCKLLHAVCTFRYYQNSVL